MTHTPLTKALDTLYRGPDEATTVQAQAKLRAALAKYLPQTLFYDVVADAQMGNIFVVLNARGLCAVRFAASERAFIESFAQAKLERAPDRAAHVVRQVRDYLAGTRLAFDLPLDWGAMPKFQQQVLQEAARIPRGQVVTYGEVARRIQRPKAARAVGQALSHNPMPIVIPCHRVLASDGSLRGYLGQSGTAAKAHLLTLEGATLHA